MQPLLQLPSPTFRLPLVLSKRSKPKRKPEIRKTRRKKKEKQLGWSTLTTKQALKRRWQCCQSTHLLLHRKVLLFDATKRPHSRHLFLPAPVLSVYRNSGTDIWAPAFSAKLIGSQTTDTFIVFLSAPYCRSGFQIGRHGTHAVLTEVDGQHQPILVSGAEMSVFGGGSIEDN